MKRKLIAVFATLLLLITSAFSLQSAAFSDVSDHDHAHAHAIWVFAELGIVGGHSNGMFYPDNTVTRAEAVKLIYVVKNATVTVDTAIDSPVFDDVPLNHWASPYVNWAYNNGVINEYGSNLFRPSDKVTYDEALKLICGALGYTDWEESLWPDDVREKSEELNFFASMPSDLAGSDILTRAQIVQLMYNAMFADMAETKIVNVYYPEGIVVPVEVSKVLADDVWDFDEETYVVVGTENYGECTNNKDHITLQEISAYGEAVNSPCTFVLADIGLQTFSGKTDELINLHIAGIIKDDKIYSTAIKGTIVDNVLLEYDKTRTYISINGVEYGPESFDGSVTDQIALFKIDGTKVDMPVFDDDGKLTDYICDIVDTAHFARVIDFDGNGDADAFVVVPKIAYKVDCVKTIDEVPTVIYTALDGTRQSRTPVANVSVELKKGDVFVGAKMGTTLYAEIVEPVKTYATKLSMALGKVTLDGVGEVSYTDISVAGVGEMYIDTSVLGDNNVQVYYVYNGELICVEAIPAEYNFGVLQYITKVDGIFDETTMTENCQYTASLIVDGVEKEVILSQSNTHYIAGMNYQAAELYEIFRMGINYDGTVDYPYALVAIVGESDDGYVLNINCNIDTEKYMVVPAGNYISYDAETGLYTVGDFTKVFLDESSVIYYRYFKEITGEHAHISYYTRDTIAQSSFQTITCTETYLRYNEENDTYTLLATILAHEIEVMVEDLTDYRTDGRGLLYAYEPSFIEYIDGKLYNSYYFKNLITGEKVEVEQTEYSSTTNGGTEAGAIYAYDAIVERYIKVTSYQEITSLHPQVLTSVIVDRGIIECQNGMYWKIAEDVIIWGRTADCKGRRELTVEELAEQLEMVEQYNEENLMELEIKMLLVTYLNDDGEQCLAGIIVELVEFDDDGNLCFISEIDEESYEISGGGASHTFGEWKYKYGNCAEGGYKFRTCSECGETETEIAAAQGHSYITEEHKPTCTEDGYTVHICETCGDTYTDSETEATGHSFGEWTINREPTASEEGIRLRECTSCGETETENIPKLNGAATFALSDAMAKPGETVKLTLSLKTDVPVNSIALSKLVYDSEILEFVGFADYSAIEELCAFAPVFDSNREFILIALAEEMMIDMDICTLEFKVKESATDTVTTVSATPTIKNNSEVVYTGFEQSDLNIYTYVIGDIDCDGDVDIDDATYLFGYSMLPDLFPLTYPGEIDFTKDGTVDIQDAITLFRYSMLPDIYPLM